MLRCRIYTFVQDEEGGKWEWIEPDTEATYYTAFKQGRNPIRMGVFMLRPFGRAFLACEEKLTVAYMATEEKSNRAD